MDRVSCRAFPLISSTARSCGVSLDGLFEGLPPRSHWETPDNWVTWTEWSTLIDRLTDRPQGGEDALREGGRQAVAEAKGLALGQLGSVFPDPVSLFEFTARMAGPALYRCVRFDSVLEADGRVRFTVDISRAQRPCRGWLVMLEGTLVSTPSLGGFPDAQVERVALGDRSGEWVLTLSLSAGRPTPPPRLPRVLVDELYAQQAELSAALEELRASGQDFRKALDALPLLVAVHHRGLLRWVNQAFARFFASRADQLEGRELALLFPAPQRSHLAPLLDEQPAEATLMALKEGELRALESRSTAPLSFGGRTGSLFFARDVTAEQEAHRRAVFSESTFAALLEALPDLVLRFGPDGRLISVHGGGAFPDRAFLEPAVGLTIPEMQKKWGLYETERGREFRVLVLEALRTGIPSSRSINSLRPDGRPRHLLVRCVPLHGDVLVISHDRTQQADHERRLQLAERMASVGELAAGVAHEVNNPLTSVLSNLPVLRRLLSRDGVGQEALEILSEVEDGCRRISETAARLREFSQGSPPSRRGVRLSEVLERADRMTRTELRYRARLVPELEPGLEVWGDPSELEEVLVNLLANAAQAMPEGASPETHHVWVRARAENGVGVIEVADDGLGIAADVLPRIFDPFFTTRHRRAGTGLGLAICHRIVTAHGGTIEAQSVPGRTTLTLRLPLSPAKDAGAQAAHPDASARRARVLVIDDEPSVGRSIQRVLARHEVMVLEDGRKAFSRLRDGELPDLVLCDLMMPGCTGMELYAALGQTRPETLKRVAFMSGGTFTPLASEFLKSHPVSLLNKPFPEGMLNALVERVLATGTTEGWGGA